MKPKLLNIDHIHVFVADRQAALDWYNNIFVLEPGEKIFWGGTQQSDCVTYSLR